MKRQEEIENAAKMKYPYEGGVKGDICQASIPIFVEGAKWADQHPREGLWDAEKVIEWLKDNAFEYMEDNHKYGEGCEYSTTELIEDLTKAMEE